MFRGVLSPIMVHSTIPVECVAESVERLVTELKFAAIALKSKQIISNGAKPFCFAFF